jgi:hypothetical protein
VLAIPRVVAFLLTRSTALVAGFDYRLTKPLSFEKLNHELGK